MNFVSILGGLCGLGLLVVAGLWVWAYFNTKTHKKVTAAMLETCWEAFKKDPSKKTGLEVLRCLPPTVSVFFWYEASDSMGDVPYDSVSRATIHGDSWGGAFVEVYLEELKSQEKIQ